MRRVEAVVLAAGLSRRMGGPNKILLPYGDTTVIGSVVRALRDAGIPATVVTGRDAALVEAQTPGLRAYYNDRYAEGMGSSLAAGAANIQQADGIMVVLGDMPGLDPAVLRRLHQAFDEAPHGAIVAPVYSADSVRIGHPVIFSIHYRPALCSLSGDVGARSIIEANRDRLIAVPVDGQLDDLDEPGLDQS